MYSRIFSDQETEQSCHLVKLKGSGCSLPKRKGRAYYAAIGYKILIIQIEGLIQV